MIGVSGRAADLAVADEFFELFKTPWERAVPFRKYSVVLSTDGRTENLDTELLLLYGSVPSAFDRESGVSVQTLAGPTDVAWAESTFPVYGALALFDRGASAGMPMSDGRAVEYRHQSGGQVVRRIGYDLFGEVGFLLTQGQPTWNALTPTLELHIALLRRLLRDSGVSFVEIPPRPAGFEFTCCLTHDVDFFGIRRHWFDRTLAGFIGRASWTTLTELFRGRRTLLEAVRNWSALLSLPLVFMGLAPDFWSPFDDYAQVESGRPSTFFLVPFKGRPGVGPDGTVDARRAAPYEIREIAEEAKGAAARGCELAVHGIDAWRDADVGRREIRELTSLTGGKTAGVRMHWLFFADDSPRRLESAGFDYDSTWGYNHAVGYRAGTSQVFRLSGSEKLLELPLSIMDSALFYGGRMALAQENALPLCCRIVTNARRFGGTLVINWHCRSLAPERLWGRGYKALLAEIGNDDRTWFATAGEAVAWFRWRRSICFRLDPQSGEVAIAASAQRSTIPGATVQIHRPTRDTAGYVEEVAFDGRETMRLAL